MKELIKLLSENKLCKGCQGCTCESDILIGDVMGRLSDLMTLWGVEHSGEYHSHLSRLAYTWGMCGFTRSLQEIMEDYELVDCKCTYSKIAPCTKRQLKPEAANLLKFLNEIFDA